MKGGEDEVKGKEKEKKLKRVNMEPIKRERNELPKESENGKGKARTKVVQIRI